MKVAMLLPLALLASCAFHRNQVRRPPFFEKESQVLFPRLVEIRRDLHRHPELSLHEARTAAIVAKYLRGLGLEVRTDLGGHGVVGVLHGGRPGGTVAYRADMDAFPGDESNGPNASTIPGVQHICGHDVHTTIALGVATLLHQNRAELPGTVVFLFQPAEETLQGAAAMLRDGALDSTPPSAVFAVHSFPLEVGTIAYAPGEGFAGMDEWWVDVPEQAATEHRSLETIQSLATIEAPRSLGDFQALLEQLKHGGPPLANAVFLTTNTKSKAGRMEIHAIVKAAHDEQYPGLRRTLRERLDASLGQGTYKLRFRDSFFPGMYADRNEAEQASKTLAAVLGPEHVIRYQATVPFVGEDFALFLHQIPGSMFFLGVANKEKGIVGIPHLPNFDADEQAIEVGTRAMASVLWARLAQEH